MERPSAIAPGLFNVPLRLSNPLRGEGEQSLTPDSGYLIVVEVQVGIVFQCALILL